MDCVILGAGEGKRMRPLTANIPKVMIPLANHPIIYYLLTATKLAGIVNFIIVVGYGESSIRDYFGDGSNFGVNIRYVTQRKQLGTADALKMASPFLKDRFLVLNGDSILKKEDIENLAKQNAPTMAIFSSDHPEDYGIVTIDGGLTTSLEEKSTTPKNTLINAGAYLFEPDIFEKLSDVSISPRGEFELTDALEVYVKNQQLRAYLLNYWLDIGYPWDLLDANAAILSEISHKQEGIIEAGTSIPDDVSIGEGSIIKLGTYIEGPCIIGKNCRIGPHSYIRGATSIGNNCHIGHATEIKNSIIMDRTNIPHFNYVGDSVIGSQCNFGAGTKIANLRHDRASIKVNGKNTRKMKFGAIVGDNVQIGINCSINVGSVIGSNSRIAPHSYIDGYYGDGSNIR